MLKVMLVDDEPSLLEIGSVFLEAEGSFDIHAFDSAKRALDQLELEDFDAVVSDYQMLGMDGIEFLKTVRGSGNNIPFILFTGRGREEVVIEALNYGADFYLMKGGEPKVQFAELYNLIGQAVSRRQAEEAVHHNAKRFRSLIENMSDMIMVIDVDGIIHYLSPSIERFLSYEPEEPFGTNFLKFIHPDDMEEIFDGFLEVANGSVDMVQMEARTQHRDGSWRVLEIISSKLPNDRGRVEFVVNARDITERKRAEEALEESEEVYRTVFENTGTVTAILEEDTIIAMVNTEFEELSGYSKEEIEGRMKWTEFVAEEDLERMKGYHILRRVDADRPPHSYEFRFICKNGSTRNVVVTVGMIPGTGKSIASVQDMTEYRQVEELLQKSENEKATILNALLELLIYQDKEHRIMWANRAAGESVGMSVDQLVGQHCYEIWARRSEPCGDCPVSKALETGESQEGEISHSDGRVWFISGNPIKNGNGEVIGVVEVSTDITEKKRMEEVVKRRSEERAMLLDNIETMIWYATDPETYGTVNRARAEFLGIEIEDLQGRKLRDILREDEVEMCTAGNREAFEGKKIQEEEWVSTARGDLRCVLVTKIPKMDENGNVEYVICTGQDITDRKQSEEALRVANKKLNLLGGITGHDILNQLTVMNGYGSLLENSLDDERLLNYLKNIGKASRKIEEMLEFRREYERIVTEEPEWVNVAEFVNRAAADMPWGGVSLSIDLDSLEIFADSLIGKVFYNLLQNGLEHGGDLTEIRVFDETAKHGTILVFEDDGMGIPENEKEKIFEYGFGKHLGYGLNHIREILGIYRMSIREVGEPGKGARFEIHVPEGNYRIVGSH